MTNDEKFTLDEDTTDLSAKLLTCNDEKEINNIISVFNAQLKKKNIIRANTFSELQDKIVDQMSQRIEKHSDEFSNRDLLDYMKSIQTIIDSSEDNAPITLPNIAIQQNITIGDSVLDRESKNRVLEAVRAILETNYTPEEIEDAEIIDDTTE